MQTTNPDTVDVSCWELVSRDSSSALFGSFRIASLPCFIGRGNDVEVRLPNITVSTRHAVIRRHSGGLDVEDLGSRNGTFVNGRRINCITPIGSGDLLQFGNMLLELQCTRLVLSDMTCFAGDNDDLALALSRFDRLFDPNAVQPHFQSIVSAIDRKTVAYEVLSRSPLFGLTLPKTMFEAADRLNRSAELSRFMREVALVQPGVSTEHLFLNTHPNELEDVPQLVRSLFRLRKSHPNQKITIEIHESAIADLTALQTIGIVLQDLGMGLAYDDFGAGQARLSELIEARPNVLKFDMKMIRGIDQSPPSKRQLVESLVRMAHDLGIQSLAEGIETEEEAAVCQQLGFELFQGFLFGRPVPRMSATETSVAASKTDPGVDMQLAGVSAIPASF